MKSIFLLIPFFLASCGGHQIPTESEEEGLPDDYLPITLKFTDGILEGSSEFLEGFVFSMDLSEVPLDGKLELEALMSIIKNQGALGTLVYPNGKITEIEYQVVNHRGSEEIYMKTSLGYFLWEMVEVLETEILFAIYWWYCPPAERSDLNVLEIAEALLSTEDKWNRDDDRECEDDNANNRFSLFCALKNASIERWGEYNHHNTAIQNVRFVIDELVPDHGFEHTLMDYNNAETTSHNDILKVLTMAKDKIKEEIENR